MSRTVEVRHVLPDRLLPAEFLEMGGREVEPELLFGGRRIATQVARASFQILPIAEERASRSHARITETSRKRAREETKPPVRLRLTAPVTGGQTQTPARLRLATPLTRAPQ